MSDPTLILAITAISSVGIGILGKVLFELRKNIRSCWGITFRSNSGSRDSPRQLNTVKKHFENTLPQIELSTHITPRRAFSENSSPQNAQAPTNREIEHLVRIKELEERLKRMGDDPDRIFI